MSILPKVTCQYCLRSPSKSHGIYQCTLHCCIVGHQFIILQCALYRCLQHTLALCTQTNAVFVTSNWTRFSVERLPAKSEKWTFGWQEIGKGRAMYFTILFLNLILLLDNKCTLHCCIVGHQCKSPVYTQKLHFDLPLHCGTRVTQCSMVSHIAALCDTMLQCDHSAAWCHTVLQCDHSAAWCHTVLQCDHNVAGVTQCCNVTTVWMHHLERIGTVFILRHIDPMLPTCFEVVHERK